MANIKRMTTIAAFVFVFLFTCFSVSVFAEPKQPVDTGDAEEEIWELVVTGDTESKCNMVLKQSKIEKDTYFVSGKISGKIQDLRWGAGHITFKLKGKTGKSIFVAGLSGHADMDEGEAAGVYFVYGKLKGTLSKSQGFGTWQVEHEFGSPSGEWTAKRIK